MSQNLAPPKRSPILVCIQVLALAFAAGCGSQATPDRSSLRAAHPAPVVGELAARYDEIHAHEDWTYSCDRINTQQIRDLLVELDSHAAELSTAVIQANVPAGEVSYNWDGLPIAVDRPISTAPGTIEQYELYRNSWNLTLVLRLDIGSQSIQQNASDWSRLVVRARSLLVDDAKRVIDRVKFHLDHTSAEPIAELASKVSLCGETTTWECFLSQVLSDATRNWIDDNRMYPYWIQRGSQTRSYARFKQHVATDLARVGFRPNALISRALDGTYKVPVYSADFTSEATRRSMAETFQRYWSGSNGHAEIEWVDRAELAAATIVAGSTAGERSFYDRDRREVHLFAGDSTGGFAHEMGHVFGFRDQYFTLFDYSGCQYIEEVSESNLMSSHNTGRVLESHWQKLDQMYPTPSAGPAVAAVASVPASPSNPPNTPR